MTNPTYFSLTSSFNRPTRLKLIVFTVLMLFVVVAVLTLLIVFMDKDHSSSYSSPILKATHDDREYQALTLPNALRLTLVSDPRTPASAIFVNVGVGHYADTAAAGGKFPSGTAHFLEHMLFMGTSKYPAENYADEAAAAAGGNVTAYTDKEVTNYGGVMSRNLRTMCDVMAQFFVSPLLRVSSIKRELNVVESEYRGQLSQDLWSVSQIVRSLSSEQSPFNG